MSEDKRTDADLIEALRGDPECENVRRLINDLSRFAERSGSPTRFTLNKLWWLMGKEKP